MNYRALAAGGADVAHYSWEHKDYAGIVVPTLRRALKMEPDGKTSRGSASVNIEILKPPSTGIVNPTQIVRSETSSATLIHSRPHRDSE